jgi:uncharacterized protein (TIGR00369 family)
MDFVHSWIEKSPYCQWLGVAPVELGAESARLALPFAERNTNGDQVMHGGCAASLAALGAQAVTRSALGEESGPWHSVALQVNYLAAAKSQGVFANARLLRRGKGMCFVDVDVEGEDGRPIAHATTVVRGRFGSDASELPLSAGDHGEADPGKMGPHIGRIPFMGDRKISVEHMVGGTSRLRMPNVKDANSDANGSVHEGAVLALLDTTGAMASWAVTGFGPYRAGTPSMQAQFLAPPPADDLVAYGRNTHRDAESFWSDVEVAGASDGRVFARGTVIYRIVT